MYYTGIRHLELINLNLSDIEWDTEKLRINAGKGNTYDKVNIHKDALKTLREYIDFERPNPITEHEEAIFISNQRRRMSYVGVYQTIKEIGARAKINKKIYPHMFRASLITHMDKKGASIFEIKAQSRHKKTESLQRYVRHSDEHLRKVYNRTFNDIMPEENSDFQIRTEITQIQQIKTDSNTSDLELRYKHGEINLEQLLQILEIIKNNQQPIGYQ